MRRNTIALAAAALATAGVVGVDRRGPRRRRRLHHPEPVGHLVERTPR